MRREREVRERGQKGKGRGAHLKTEGRPHSAPPLRVRGMGDGRAPETGRQGREGLRPSSHPSCLEETFAQGESGRASQTRGGLAKPARTAKKGE